MAELLGISIGLAFQETLKGISVAPFPWLRGISIGVEAKFFSIELLFSRNGNIIDITEATLTEVENLYIYNDNLIFQNSGNMLSLRPANFANPVQFTVNIPGYQKVIFNFSMVAGDMVQWVIPVSSIQPVLITRRGEVLHNAEPNNPENNLLI